MPLFEIPLGHAAQHRAEDRPPASGRSAGTSVQVVRRKATTSMRLRSTDMRIVTVLPSSHTCTLVPALRHSWPPRRSSARCCAPRCRAGFRTAAFALPVRMSERDRRSRCRRRSIPSAPGCSASLRPRSAAARCAPCVRIVLDRSDARRESRTSRAEVDTPVLPLVPAAHIPARDVALLLRPRCA